MQKLEGLKGKGALLGEKRKAKSFEEIEAEVADFGFYPRRVIKAKREPQLVEVKHELEIKRA